MGIFSVNFKIPPETTDLLARCIKPDRPRRKNEQGNATTIVRGPFSIATKIDYFHHWPFLFVGNSISNALAVQTRVRFRNILRNRSMVCAISADNPMSVGQQIERILLHSSPSHLDKIVYDDQKL